MGETEKYQQRNGNWRGITNMDLFDILMMISENLIIFQIVTDMIKVTIGAGLCFGALKWRKGLLTTVAVAWGLILGIMIAYPIGEAVGFSAFLICGLIGMILLPILTYTIAGVNRFVLGFLVASKLFFMLTTVLAKDGTIEISTALILPLAAGTMVGILLMACIKIRVSSFVLACSFLGASEIAPVISEWVNRILFTATGDIEYLFDPIDMIFALFKIELTDMWMLISMIIFMVWGIYTQIKKLKEDGIPLETPIIGFEISKR